MHFRTSVNLHLWSQAQAPYYNCGSAQRCSSVVVVKLIKVHEASEYTCAVKKMNGQKSSFRG